MRAADAPLAETALEFAKAFPLLPIPVVASPLYMVLSDTDAQAGEYPAIVNSFAQLRFFAWAEKIIFEATEEVGKAKRQKAREEMHKTMFEVRTIVSLCARAATHLVARCRLRARPSCPSVRYVSCRRSWPTSRYTWYAPAACARALVCAL